MYETDSPGLPPSSPDVLDDGAFPCKGCGDVSLLSSIDGVVFFHPKLTKSRYSRRAKHSNLQAIDGISTASDVTHAGRSSILMPTFCCLVTDH